MVSFLAFLQWYLLLTGALMVIGRLCAKFWPRHCIRFIKASGWPQPEKKIMVWLIFGRRLWESNGKKSQAGKQT